jgi:hypothetical protein
MHAWSPQLRWLVAALFLTAALAALHVTAIIHFWYWEYRWFDTPMHVLGGMAIGATAIGIMGRPFRPLLYIGIVSFAFLGWELFEEMEGIAVTPGLDYTWDSAHDLLNDAIGAALSYLAARTTIWRSV